MEEEFVLTMSWKVISIVSIFLECCLTEVLY